MLQAIKHIFLQPHKWSRWIRTCILDMKYGNRYLGWKVLNGDPKKGWHGSQNSNYEAFPLLFSNINIKPEDVIVDVGCGKGRVFNWMLNQGYKNKLIGIEVDVAVGEFAKKRLRKYPQVEIIIGDVVKNLLPDTGTIFYLAHPFTIESLVRNFHAQIIDKIEKGIYNKSNRPILIYYNCVHLKVFEENKNWKITKLGHITFTHFPAAIIEYIPG